MSETQSTGDENHKIFIGIDPETGEMAEYILGIPCAELDETGFLEAPTDPRIGKLINDAQEIGRQYDRLQDT
jgi:hypothetical protein